MANCYGFTLKNIINLLWFLFFVAMKQVFDGHNFTARNAKVMRRTLGNSKHDPILFLPFAYFADPLRL